MKLNRQIVSAKVWRGLAFSLLLLGLGGEVAAAPKEDPFAGPPEMIRVFDELGSELTSKEIPRGKMASVEVYVVNIEGEAAEKVRVDLTDRATTLVVRSASTGFQGRADLLNLNAGSYVVRISDPSLTTKSVQIIGLEDPSSIRTLPSSLLPEK